MRQFAATIRLVLLATLAPGAIGAPGLMHCVSDCGAVVEWAFAPSCTPMTTLLLGQADCGGGRQCCGRCADNPVRGNDLYRSSDRPHRVTMDLVSATPAVLSAFLPTSREFLPDLPQHPAPSADSLRSIVLLI
jgi:hypothetical protein